LTPDAQAKDAMRKDLGHANQRSSESTSPTKDGYAMSSAEYGAIGVQNRTRTLFGQVMWSVATTAGLFALGAYLGRNLGNGPAFVFYLLAFVCLIGMRFTIRSSAGLSMTLLLAVGLLMGLGTSPMLTYYAEADPHALWEAGAATALFIAGCGAFGYATRTDLSGLARAGFWALLALIGFGVVLIFVHIPGGAVIYSILGLVIFAGLTMVDFQRLRRSTDMDSAPLIAASIFLDALNVFQFFLQLFGGRGRD
jgi:FtsH-binding integral membrane protein